MDKGESNMRLGKMIIAVSAVGCGVWIGSMLTTFASGIPAAGQPGSSEDPVVTKSYVDEQIQNALSGGTVGESGTSATIDALTDRIAALEKALADKGSGVSYTVVRLKAGHTLLGGTGTEFNVRTGKAYVHSNTENGIPDLTDGVDLKNEALIPNNHLLQVPREGRGVKVKPDYPNDVYVTIKGLYVELDTEGNSVSKE
jgi:hypothetical protein